MGSVNYGNRIPPDSAEHNLMTLSSSSSVIGMTLKTAAL